MIDLLLQYDYTQSRRTAGCYESAYKISVSWMFPDLCFIGNSLAKDSCPILLCLIWSQACMRRHFQPIVSTHH
jgi:hypothetical protein